jgi:hypothetical protein
MTTLSNLERPKQRKNIPILIVRESYNMSYGKVFVMQWYFELYSMLMLYTYDWDVSRTVIVYVPFTSVIEVLHQVVWS